MLKLLKDSFLDFLKHNPTRHMSKASAAPHSSHIPATLGKIEMMENPKYPLIVVDKTSYLDVVQDEEQLTNCSAYGLIKGFYKSFQAFDSSGRTWRVKNVQSKYPINSLTKFLAYTFYNPSIKVQLSWKASKVYSLDELKKELNKQIDKDDDIITQFVDGSELKSELNRCITVSEVIEVLNKRVFTVKD